MKKNRGKVTTAVAAVGVSTALVAGAVAAAPAAKADSGYPNGPVYLFGYIPSTDGFWGPSHGNATAVIPICQGPVAVARWLDVNFSDHGKDAEAYLKRNGATLTKLANGTLNPLTALYNVGQAIWEIPVYAANDTLFHLPATAVNIISLCGLIRLGNLNATVPAT